MLSNLTITGLYAGLLGIMFVALAFNVIRFRFKYKTGIGDGGHQELAVAIRVHGNFSEYIPLFLLLLASYELNGGNATLLHVFGSAVVIGRICHLIGLTKTIATSAPRFIGMMSIFISIIVLSVLNILNFIG